MIDNVYSITFSTNHFLVLFSGLCSSLPYDFLVKSGGKGDLRSDSFDLFPIPKTDLIEKQLILRSLCLNCLTIHYADLWEELYVPDFSVEYWSQTDSRLSSWKALTPHWQREVALRNEFERRQALVEIDVLVSMALGLTMDELLTIYRVQFPVLQQNEQRLRFDQRGYVVPVKTISGEFGVDESHPDFPSMVPPFTSVDREADYRQAWAHFEQRLAAEKETAVS